MMRVRKDRVQRERGGAIGLVGAASKLLVGEALRWKMGGSPSGSVCDLSECMSPTSFSVSSFLDAFPLAPNLALTLHYHGYTAFLHPDPLTWCLVVARMPSSLKAATLRLSDNRELPSYSYQSKRAHGLISCLLRSSACRGHQV